MSARQFRYSRLMQFYETDAMGIIHHANYFRLLEEARLVFLRELWDFEKQFDRLDKLNYPLTHCELQFLKPLRFSDEVQVNFQVSIHGARLLFEYQLSTKNFANPVAFGKTEHVAFDMKNQRPRKIPQTVRDFLDLP